MKILLVNDHHTFGGAENYVRSLEEKFEPKFDEKVNEIVRGQENE
jgi:hypothetical protein